MATVVCSVLATACGSVLLSACSPYSGASGNRTQPPGRGLSSRTEASTTTGAATTEAQMTASVVTAWLAAEQAFNAAALTADPDQPELAVTTVSPQLDWSRSLLEEMRSAGQVARGTVDYGTPRVSELGARRAVVETCVHDAEIVVSAASGQPDNGVLGQVDFELINSTMELTDSGWKLLTQQVGVGKCD